MKKKLYFCKNKNITIMARFNKQDIDFTGSVGSFTVRGKGSNKTVSERIRRQTTTRTVSGMKNKLPLNNLIAMRRVLKDDELERFEGFSNKSKSQGQYVKVNAGRGVVYLPKDMLSQGGCVLVGHQVSAGSLPTIGHRYIFGNRVATDIRLSAEIAAETTVGDFAADLLRLNVDFAEGDVLSVYYLRQVEDKASGIPRVVLSRRDIELDSQSQQLLKKVVRMEELCVEDGCLALKKRLTKAAVVFVHKRPMADGTWRCSTQELMCHNSLINKYNTEAAFVAAAQAYGTLVEGKGGEAAHEVTEGEVPQQVNKRHVVTAFSCDEALGSVSGELGVYFHDSQLSLVAVPNEGYRFLHWTDHLGHVVGNEEVLTVRVVANESYMAWFGE